MLPDQLELFFVFIVTHIIHLAQFVYLLESKVGFAQITNLGLRIILTYVLIRRWRLMIEFIKDHDIFIRLLRPPAALLVQLHQVLLA